VSTCFPGESIIEKTGRVWIAGGLALMLCGACGGAIEIDRAPARPRDPGGASQTGAGEQLPGNAGYAPPAPALRRLTVPQYQNSVRDLFGDTSLAPTELEADTVLHGFAAIGASQVAFSPRASELLEDAAFDLAGRALSNQATRQSLVGCAPSADPAGGCAREFLRRFGRRAWRRALSDAELQRYATIAAQAATELGDPWAGLEYAVAGLLQSPSFLYRVEIGNPHPSDPGLRVFDGFELATRLSFFVWNTTPDDALLDAAEAGVLSSPDGLAAEAMRLLESPRARGALSNFWSEMLRLAELDELPQLPSAYPLITKQLGASMRSETLAVLNDLVFDRDADYRELFSSRSTFVNQELAQLYGLSPVAGNDVQPVILPPSAPRAGLLGQGSFLALGAHAASTSPTRRGKLVREVLLCQAIPPPPPNVSTEFLPDPAGDVKRTMRQKLEFHRTDPNCAACHALMDPVGLALEHFDGLGAYRERDGNLPIDASGELDGASFQDALGLGMAVGAHPELATCLGRNLFRYATGRLETGAEEALVQGLSGGFAGDQYRVKRLLLAVIGSDAFRFAGKLD
jgi:hypothetical protein